ncbi:hypothetical protein Tco_1070468 [Tanacetum coccineum]|uniref:Uncharacterized protein n=1 Tax=Tanacetum coccineum TaxID=301880 RepID=A0ABQ5HMV3_9ASTR
MGVRIPSKKLEVLIFNVANVVKYAAFTWDFDPETEHVISRLSSAMASSTSRLHWSAIGCNVNGKMQSQQVGDGGTLDVTVYEVWGVYSGSSAVERAEWRRRGKGECVDGDWVVVSSMRDRRCSQSGHVGYRWKRGQCESDYGIAEDILDARTSRKDDMRCLWIHSRELSF